MRARILSATPGHLKAEIRDYFRRFPINEMSRSYSNQHNVSGCCMPDAQIFLLPADDGRLLLTIYLHEIAHASLIYQQHPRWYLHEEDFNRIRSELQLRYGVFGIDDDNYCQQDAVMKTSQMQLYASAIRHADEAYYDPLQQAAQASQYANSSSMRQSWNTAIITVGLAVTISFFVIGGGFSSIIRIFDSNNMKLVAGLGCAAFLWWFTRNPD